MVNCIVYLKPKEDSDKETLYHLAFFFFVQKVFTLLFNRPNMAGKFGVYLYVGMDLKFHTYFLLIIVCSFVKQTAMTALLFWNY